MIITPDGKVGRILATKLSQPYCTFDFGDKPQQVTIVQCNSEPFYFIFNYDDLRKGYKND